MEDVRMRLIEAFVTPDFTVHSSYGYGYGYGSGYGSGYGNGSGSGYGSSSGYGDGDGNGYGDGYGNGSGSGYGSSSGHGDGDGYGVKRFDWSTVYEIDKVPTLIDRVHGCVAKGRILNRDLTTTPCYIVKSGHYYAHGETLREAQQALEEKILDDLPVEEKIAEFLRKFKPQQKYPARQFYDWHHFLTGSCEMGRKQFAKDRQIDIDSAEFTPEEFMDMTKDDYGGSVIRQLMEAWERNT